MWYNTQCRNTHCHNTQAFWIIDYKSKYKSSSVKITTGKIFRIFEWVLWKFLDEKCIFQMICTHGTHDKVRLKNASMIWSNLRLEKGEIWYKHFFQTIYLFSIFLNYQIYIKHYDTMTCICLGIETPKIICFQLFVFSIKNLKHRLKIFCVLSFDLPKLLEKAEMKHLELVVFSVYEMW